jgi:hypothetical protein
VGDLLGRAGKHLGESAYTDEVRVVVVEHRWMRHGDRG